MDKSDIMQNWVIRENARAIWLLNKGMGGYSRETIGPQINYHKKWIYYWKGLNYVENGQSFLFINTWKSSRCADRFGAYSDCCATRSCSFCELICWICLLRVFYEKIGICFNTENHSSIKWSIIEGDQNQVATFSLENFSNLTRWAYENVCGSFLINRPALAPWLLAFT